MATVADEFMEFLREYKVIGLSIAFIMGAATTALVSSLVDDIIMPFINPIMPGEEWENAIISLGPVDLRWGSFAAEMINFTILAFVVFMIARIILKREKVKKV